MDKPEVSEENMECVLCSSYNDMVEESITYIKNDVDDDKRLYNWAYGRIPIAGELHIAVPVAQGWKGLSAKVARKISNALARL